MACRNHPDREAAAVCVECQEELCSECRRIGPDGRSYCAEHVPATQAAPGAAGAAIEMPPGQVAGAAADVAHGSTGLAAACYFSWVLAPVSFVLPVIPLASADMKQSRFMRYHAYNGLFWGIAVVAIFVVLEIALGLGGLVRVPGLLLLPLRGVRMLWGVAALIASVLFAIKASSRQQVRIPLVSDLAERQAK